MRLLVVVAEVAELAPMKNLLVRAGIKDYKLCFLFDNIDCKPSMKELRQVKEHRFDHIAKDGFDYILAAGETAARLVLDTSSVNINKMRGRDYEFKLGVKDIKKKTKSDDIDHMQGEENEDRSKTN